MDRELLSWILNEFDETRLQQICKSIKVKIPGFRSNQKYPKFLMIPNLLKNINKVYSYFEEIADVSEENKEFDGKDLIEIKSLLDINNKDKTIEQIIYLMSQNKLEYTNLVYEIVDRIKKKDNIGDGIIIGEEKKNKNQLGLNQIVDISKIGNEKKDDNMVNDERSINKFIVTVEQKSGFYNIYPLYKIENGELIRIEGTDYPEYGNINVYPWLEFSKKNYDIICPLWICRFNPSELEETKNRTKFRINGDKLLNNKDIYDMNSEGIYEISEILEDSNDFQDLIYKDKISIKNKPIKEKVYIKDDKYIYGPFKYEENNRGGGYYIDKEKNDYIVEKYFIKDNEANLSIVEIDNPYDYSNSYIKAVYFYNKENLISEKIDTISDQKLLDKLKKIVDVKNMCGSKDEIENIRKNIDSIIFNSLSEERRERIEKYIRDTRMTEEFIEKNLTELINVLLDGKETRQSISNKILQQNEILRKLQNVELVQAKIESKNEEIERAKQELEKVKLEIEDVKNQNKQNLMQEMQIEIKELQDKKERISISIEELTKKYDLCNEIKSLVIEKERIEDEAQKAREEYNVFSRNNQDIQKEIKDKLDNITSISKYSDIAFDGIIANEILESAAKWSKKRYIESYEDSIASKEKVGKVLNIKSFKDREIIDYICNKFKKFRNYSRNDIINMMMCITQGFITVFAGEPGVGKTSACNIITNILGLSNKDSNYNRFTEVSVEKGWTSKRDLIGYYNPLTKSFDKNDGLLYKTFNILDQEYKREINDFPYFVLLDEANLSSMEHYWADFMNCCDLNKEDRKINLGEEYIYYLPKTLRFLATINYDHTTETLSPRLIDRAWIILLETNKNNFNFNNDEEYQQAFKDIIMFKDLETIFSLDYKEEDGLSNQIFNELDEIYKKFNENNIVISPRIHSMIIKYLKVGCSLLDETENTPSSEFVALDYAVAQKLLPKINGYGEEYKIFLQDIQHKFGEKNMVKCENIVNNIIKKGNANMQYYQFFS